MAKPASYANFTAMQQIFHPTDLGSGSDTAFVHALRIASLMGARLTVMHVSDSRATDDIELPGVRERLAQWGLIRDAQDTQGMEDLRVGIHKVIVSSSDPVSACVAYLADHPTDLIVLATHQRAGRIGWVEDRSAEPIQRESGRPTLFLPYDKPGFVHADSGVVMLRRIIVPVAADPDPAPALHAAVSMAGLLADAPVTISLVHVGDPTDTPQLELPQHPLVTWEKVNATGEVHEAVLQVATERQADLIVMRTKGHDGFLDVLRGNTTERILRRSPCALLAITDQ